MDRNKANSTSGGTNVFLGKVIISVLSRTNCSSNMMTFCDVSQLSCFIHQYFQTELQTYKMN